jgi:TadE-like protein
VEFFLILPLVVFVLLAGIQVVAAAQLRVELQGAAREGVRVAATTPDPSRAVAAVIDALDPSTAGRARISVNRPATPGQPASVSVIVRHTVRLFLLPDISFDLAARAAMRTER